MFTGPNIVKNGLVLWLDAANTKSYPGSGTTWADLSGNNNSGSLVNGPTFSSANGGSIVFDGVNDYGQVSYNPVLNFCTSLNDLPFTISSWCYVNSLTNGFTVCNKGDTGGGVEESYAFGINTSGNFFLTLYDNIGSNQSSKVANSMLSVLTWYNITATYTGTGGNSGISLYVNGILQGSQNQSAGAYTRMRVQTTNLYLASFGTTGIYSSKSNGRIANTQIYNRALSQAEVQQNYNATKARFGL